MSSPGFPGEVAEHARRQHLWRCSRAPIPTLATRHPLILSIQPTPLTGLYRLCPAPIEPVHLEDCRARGTDQRPIQHRSQPERCRPDYEVFADARPDVPPATVQDCQNAPVLEVLVVQVCLRLPADESAEHGPSVSSSG